MTVLRIIAEEMLSFLGEKLNAAAPLLLVLASAGVLDRLFARTIDYRFGLAAPVRSSHTGNN